MTLKPVSFSALTIYAGLASGYANSYGSSPTTPATGVPACDALISAGLADRVLLPTSPSYDDRIESFWSYNSRLHPWCIVQPQTAQEVAVAVTALVSVNDGAGDWYIAVRSGGHNLAASNNIDNGVTIDLSLLNAATYDKSTNLASVGPGGKWMDVYRTLLDQYNVSVVGGRDGDVGVGGFTTGGGISYYSPRMGFTCDNVASMQVVLANGSIVTAGKDENNDLFVALKGGSLNTGIVTHFDVEAFPAQNLTYGQQIIAYDHSQDFAQSVVDFTTAQGPDEVLIPTWTRMPALGNKTVILAIKVNTVGNNDTSAFDQINKIPAIDDTGMVSMSLADAAAGSQIPAGMRTFWRTLTFSNNADILNRCAELHEDFVSELVKFVPADAFNSIVIAQPFPQKFIQASQKKGRNVLGLERMNGNALLWTGGVQLNPNKTNEAQFATAQALVEAYAAQLEQYAREKGGLKEYVALNYADASQDPLSTYGAANVQFIWDVAKKYDPKGVFQQRIPGGFKISRVS